MGPVNVSRWQHQNNISDIPLIVIILGVLWCGAFPRWTWFLTRGKIHPLTWADCKVGRFCFDFCRFCSSWLLVIMSVEKFFALYFPLKTKSICTVRIAKRVCLFTTCIFAVYELQLFFIRKAGKNKNGLPICTWINVPSGYSQIYCQITTILYSFGPFTPMVITNSAIICKLLMAKWLSK